MTSAELLQLIGALDDIAASTWHKVERGPARGLKFGEESLTDHNLFELDRLSDAVEVYKFTHPEEAQNGADFDWYVGSDTQRWIGMRFQAKKLDDGGYAELGHRVGAERQYNLLLRQAVSDGVWPFYCFYNGWDGGWPFGVRNRTCRADQPPTPRRLGRRCMRARAPGGLRLLRRARDVRRRAARVARPPRAAGARRLPRP